MTFGEYLFHLRRKNPSLCGAGKITLTVESFEKQLQLAFEAGKSTQPKTPEDPFDGLFGNLWGKK